MSLALEEGLRDVTVPETLSVVFEENNGKLVLISGPLDVPDALVDEKYGISIKAAKLRKVVQVFSLIYSDPVPLSVTTFKCSLCYTRCTSGLKQKTRSQQKQMRSVTITTMRRLTATTQIGTASSFVLKS